jgi:hypothetical protein
MSRPGTGSQVVEEGRECMAKNVDRALRLVNAAVRLVVIETAFSARNSAPGATAAKRELKAAYEDYMSHHSKLLKP